MCTAEVIVELCLLQTKLKSPEEALEVNGSSRCHAETLTADGGFARDVKRVIGSSWTGL